MRLEQPLCDRQLLFLFLSSVFSGVIGVGICSMDGSSRIARRLEFFCSIVKRYDNLSKHDYRSIICPCVLEKQIAPVVIILSGR